MKYKDAQVNKRSIINLGRVDHHQHGILDSVHNRNTMNIIIKKHIYVTLYIIVFSERVNITTKKSFLGHPSPRGQ